jgi:hypothetical protein
LPEIEEPDGNREVIELPRIKSPAEQVFRPERTRGPENTTLFSAEFIPPVSIAPEAAVEMTA